LEIDGTLGTIGDLDELRGYWTTIKWYLQANRPFFGKDFENMVARKFDALVRGLEARNDPRP
jgi:hypothetical protein